MMKGSKAASRIISGDSNIITASWRRLANSWPRDRQTDRQTPRIIDRNSPPFMLSMQPTAEQNKPAIMDHVNMENHVVNWDETSVSARLQCMRQRSDAQWSWCLHVCVSYSNVEWRGSAVCVYSLSSINSVFDSGAWLQQTRLESAWLRVSNDDVPTPRPGQVCCTLLA